MQFNATTNTLFRIAAADLEDASMDVKITAKEKTGSKKSVSIPLSIVIRTVSSDKGATTATKPAGIGAQPTESRGGYLSLAGDSTGHGQSSRVLLAVLLPLLLLLVLGTCLLFWYFHRSPRDISGPLPGSLTNRPLDLIQAQPLPDFSERFGKSFSADDVFGTKKAYVESRSAFHEAKRSLP